VNPWDDGVKKLDDKDETERGRFRVHTLRIPPIIPWHNAPHEGVEHRHGEGGTVEHTLATGRIDRHDIAGMGQALRVQHNMTFDA